MIRGILGAGSLWAIWPAASSHHFFQTFITFQIFIQRHLDILRLWGPFELEVRAKRPTPLTGPVCTFDSCYKRVYGVTVRCYTSLELLRAVKLSVLVFRVVMTVRIHTNVSEVHMASIFRSELQPWRWNQFDPAKYWYTFTNRRGITTHTTFIAMCFVVLCAVTLRTVLFSLFPMESFVTQFHNRTI
jgi:hypothetical protein